MSERRPYLGHGESDGKGVTRSRSTNSFLSQSGRSRMTPKEPRRHTISGGVEYEMRLLIQYQKSGGKVFRHSKKLILTPLLSSSISELTWAAEKTGLRGPYYPGQLKLEV
ncbi:hypothetical protein L345_07680, partial [Ophiophagus hannah]